MGHGGTDGTLNDGAVFGFVGLLVAVPMAAMIGVVIRFALAQYKTGRLYRGLSGSE